MQASTGITDRAKRTAGYSLYVCIISLVSLVLAAGPTGQHLDRVAYDTCITRPDQAPVPGNIVIVALDDISFDVMADETNGFGWPFPRAFHAQVLSHLAQAGARAVFFDIILDLESGFGPDDDDAFKKALKKVRTVLAGEYGPVTNIGPLLHFIDAGGIPANIRIPLDIDHKVRFMSGSRPFPGSFLASLDYFTGGFISFLTKARPDSSLAEGVHSIPSVEQALLTVDGSSGPRQAPGFIHFHGPAGSFETISYFEVFNKDLFADHAFRFKDKIVFIGRTISASVTPDQQPDVFPVPYAGSMMAGVEIHANAYATLENGQVKYLLLPGVMLAVILFWFAGVAVMLRRLNNPWKEFWFTVGCLALLMAGHYLLYINHLVWLISPFVFYIAISYVVSLAWQYIKERDRRMLTQTQLFHYLPKRVAAHVLKHPQQLAMAGDRTIVTLLFADIAKFTTLSETYTPEVIIPMLQSHLRDMTQVIFDHDGTLDKYLGDGIMAFWGAPEAQPEHADLALAAAMAMLATLDQANEKRRQDGFEGLYLRIGLHTGEAVVGNIGSDLFIDYTAIGDNVNTASRIEGAGKYFDTRITVSQECLLALTNDPPQRLARLGNVTVKGRKAPLSLFTIARENDWEAHKALAPFFELMDKTQFEAAKKDLDAILASYPDFGPARFHWKKFQSKSLPSLTDDRSWYWQLEGK